MKSEQVNINEITNNNIGELKGESNPNIPYTLMKIGFDFTSFIKPWNMTDDIYNKLKKFIIDTGSEYHKFMKVQHYDYDFTQIENKVMEECQIPKMGSDNEDYLKDYDIMIFPVFDNLSERVIAGGLSCILLKYNNKPIIGVLYININLDLNLTNIDIFIKRFLMHEFAHILGFDNSILQKNGLLKQNNQNGLHISSPRVLSEARKNFGCVSLERVPFENQGGDWNAGIHWESRYILGDYMVSTS